MPRQRLSLQLTPLLDLLLIVIFAQHLEVLQNAESAQQAVAQQRTQLQAEQQRLAAEVRQQQVDLQAADAVRQAAVEQQRQEYDVRFQSILDQHQQVGSALAEAFQLPGELLEQISRLRTDGQPADAQRLARATQQLQQAVSTRGREFLQFVIRYDEMQKHVSIWEVHIQDNGQALFTDGQQFLTVSFQTTDEFASRIFEASKTLQDPRTLVLVLLTYGDAQAGLRRKATEAMPQLMAALRSDAANTRWFDFSLLGFRAQGPVFRQAGPGQP